MLQSREIDEMATRGRSDDRIRIGTANDDPARAKSAEIDLGGEETLRMRIILAAFYSSIITVDSRTAADLRHQTAATIPPFAQQTKSLWGGFPPKLVREL